MQLLIPAMLTMALLGSPVFSSADNSLPAESAKKRIERERQLLYRTVNDLNKPQEYVQAAVRGLEKQIDAINILDPSGREEDLESFLERKEK